MVKNFEIHEQNYMCGPVKSRLAEIVLVATGRITKIAAGPQWRNVVSILVFFGLCLILVPNTALATTHRASESQRSLILPPPQRTSSTSATKRRFIDR